MKHLRGDIADAARRMRVVFGTRSAMRHLVHSLQEGEVVREMVACLFAGANGLLVLTDRRVLALRDDYSRYSMRAAPLEGITLIDYGPTVHDGFAVFTEAGRVAVRKMDRQDADRLVDALTQTLPDVPVVTSRPIAGANKPATRQGPRASGGEGAPRLALIPGDVSSGSVPTGAAPVVVAGPDGSSTQFIATSPDASGTTTNAASAVSVDSGRVTPSEPAGVVPTSEAPAAPAGQVPTDQDVLLGVLADLHARGLLTAEELAVKVAAVAASP